MPACISLITCIDQHRHVFSASGALTSLHFTFNHLDLIRLHLRDRIPSSLRYILGLEDHSLPNIVDHPGQPEITQDQKIFMDYVGCFACVRRTETLGNRRLLHTPLLHCAFSFLGSCVVGNVHASTWLRNMPYPCQCTWPAKRLALAKRTILDCRITNV